MSRHMARLAALTPFGRFGFALALAAIAAPVSIHPRATQRRPPGPPPKQKKLPEPPAQLPRVDPSRTRGLDFLFGALKAAPNAESAKHVEGRIWAIWNATPSDTASL